VAARARTGLLIGFALAIPGVAVALITGISGIAALAGWPLMPAPRPMSLPEAAVTFDPAEVVLRVGSGEDLNRAAPVHVPRLGDHPVMLTPLEAAVASRGPDMVTLVRDLGARLDEPTLRRLRCLAERVGDQDVSAYLAALNDAPLSCEGVQLPW
jgi:hypothetical protein